MPKYGYCFPKFLLAFYSREIKMSWLFEVLYTSALLAVLSYFLHVWSYRGGHGDPRKKVKFKPKKNKDTGKKQDKKTGHYALDKWLGMGGGFYGTVAIYKLIIIEMQQAIEFLGNWSELIAYFQNFGLNTIIQFFIGQIQNFVAAIIWPTDYLGRYSWLEIGFFFAMTYGAYLVGQDRAQTDYKNQITETIKAD